MTKAERSPSVFEHWHSFDYLAEHAATFPAGSLRETFEQIVKIPLRLPGSPDLTTLGRKLSILAGLASLQRGPWQTIWRQRVMARDAMGELQKSLSPLIEYALEKQAESGDLMSALYIDELRKLRNLQGSIEALQELNYLFVAPPQISGWKDIAPILAELFKDAMRNANPHKTFGNSNGGPVAKFVSAMIPMITGELIKPESVSAHLKGRKSQ
jgi:hypothetical protein